MSYRNKRWRVLQRARKQRALRGITPPAFQYEKNWKHLYTRSVKVRRARQLGFEYPRYLDYDLGDTYD